MKNRHVSVWAKSAAAPSTPRAVDNIDAYLDEPPIPSSVVEAAGGAMKYWYAQETSCPTVALMAQDFISAPGKHPFTLHNL